MQRIAAAARVTSRIGRTFPSPFNPRSHAREKGDWALFPLVRKGLELEDRAARTMLREWQIHLPRVRPDRDRRAARPTWGAEAHPYGARTAGRPGHTLALRQRLPGRA